MTYEGAKAANAVPCGLLEQAIVMKPIAKGGLITHDNVKVDAGSRIVALRRRQDDMLSEVAA